jgi:hypothetical protein
MYSGGIIIHIDENLDDDGIHTLERELSDEEGVYSACVHQKARHLMPVDFDSSVLQPSTIVHAVRNKGLRAEMVGF